MHSSQLIHRLIKTLFFFLLFFQLLITSQTGFCQRNELGIFFGTSYYLGDLNPTYHFSLPRMGIGGLYRYNINENLSIRANGYWGSIAGSDAIVKHNPVRNLHFRTNILEASLQGEVNFSYFIPGDFSTPATPYLFGGYGIFRFNPQAEINGQWYNLKPLHTEGQGSELYPDRKPYSLVLGALVFGVGLKFNITRQFSGAFEWGIRRTSTDYLDDVSQTYPDPAVFGGNPIALEMFDRTTENRRQNTHYQRGDPSKKDWYSFAGIILTIRIKDPNKYRCPAYN